MSVTICCIQKKKFLTKTKESLDLFMNVHNAGIWKRQEREMNGTIVFISKIMAMDRMMEVHSNLQLTKNALKIQLCREGTILDVQIQICVEAHRLLLLAILQKIDLI